MRNLFRGWLLFWRLRGETRARRKARQWSKEALTCLRRMQRAQKELGKFQRKQEVWFEDIREEINKADNQQQSLLAEAVSAASDCEKTIKRFDQIEDNYNHELKVYREIINDTELDLTDQLFIEKQPISVEKLKEILTKKTDNFVRFYIDPTIAGYKTEMYILKEFHKENINNIHYLAFEMDKNVEKYKDLFNKVKSLENRCLIYLEDTEEDREGWREYRSIIADINEVTAEDLIEN
jgi:hypothetical protein